MKTFIFLLALTITLTFPAKALAVDRIGVVFNNGDLYVKEGPHYAEWKQLTSGVDIGSINMIGNYISVIDKGGSNPHTLSLKDPLLTSTWEMIHMHNAKKVAMTKLSNGLYRIVILQTDGTVVMKDGVWNSGYWSGTLGAGVKDIVVGGDNVGVIMTNGDFMAKDLSPETTSHPNNVPWLLIAQNITEAAMTNDRLAVLKEGAVIAKEGGVNGQWYSSPIYEYASKVRLASDRICAITNPGQLRVECKEGALSAQPVLTYLDAVDFKITPNRFMALKSDGRAEVMDGTLSRNGGWNFVAWNNAAKIELGY